MFGFVSGVGEELGWMFILKLRLELRFASRESNSAVSNSFVSESCWVI